MTAPNRTPELDAQTLRPIIERALAMAADAGASSAEVGVSNSQGLSLNVRHGEVESLEFQRDQSLSLTVYLGQRRGNASTSDLSDRSLLDTVAAALAIASATEEDPCSGLADPALLATEFPFLDLDHPWDLSAEAAIDLARACEAAALGVDPRIVNSEGASLSSQRSATAYGNSHGFIGTSQGSQHSLMCAVIAEENGSMQRDYWYDYSRDASRLSSPEAIGRRAGERSVARLGASGMATAAMPVLYVPEVARSLFGHFIGAISGHALYRKSSFLLDALDQEVFASHVNIRQLPFLRGGMSSTAFDNEGVATRERQLIDRGVLRGWLLSSYSARKLGLQTTGNAGGVFNLVVEPGALDFDALLREVGNGLLLTELMGSSVNPVTGHYSRGAAGFRIENGEITTPVENITVAGNLKDIYRGIRCIGADIDRRGSIQCGSVLVDTLTIAGN